jgi:hypothetical protein
MTLAMRPCGACEMLVPAATGCEHWRPRADARAAEMMRLKAERGKAVKKDSRAARAKARENARLSVEKFYREQGLGPVPTRGGTT